MIDELTTAIEAYHQKWHQLVHARANQAFFQTLQPTAVGWKVKDRAAYDQVCAELHDQTDQIVETWMNGRWIAKLHLRESRLPGDIEIVKIMQRRPDSDDAIGLDHLDFYSKQVADAAEILAAEPDLKWSHEHNDVIEGYEWLSIWFDGTEAKLKSDTVLDIIVAELNDLSIHIKGDRK
jgi:hypothetical protein